MKERNDFILGGESPKAEPFHYVGCGLDDVYLLNGYELHERGDEQGYSIKDMDGLHKAIGLYVVRRKQALSGKEIRFLRRELDLTQAELGELAGISDQTVARWEKDEQEMHEAHDRILRLVYEETCLGKVCVMELLKAMKQKDEPAQSRSIYASDRDGWQVEAVA